MKNLFKDCEAELRATACLMVIILSLIFVLMCVVQSINYYQAGIKAKAWTRQGYDITQWEAFVGVEPLCTHENKGDKK